MENWKLLSEYDFHGRSIRYGNVGKGPAVVLVHGTPWSPFNLRHIINGLSQEFTVYYFDLLGYGQSDKGEGDVSLGVQNQVLEELIDHWEIDCPSIVGHDFGGATILRNHLIDHRDFKKIVLIDPVAISPWGSPFFLHVRKHEEAFAGVPDYIHEAIVRAYIGTALFKDIEQTTLDSTISPWIGAKGKRAFYRQIAQADSRFTDEVQQLYGNITAPVLILWGAEDAWIPVDRAQILRRSIPGSQFKTIPDSGHLVIEEQPEQLIQEILKFLNS
jgi:pimeloyl-ACP methyl ester carboxylesterase